MSKHIEDKAKSALLDYNGNMYEFLPTITHNIERRIIPERFLGPDAPRENHYYLNDAILAKLAPSEIKHVIDEEHNPEDGTLMETPVDTVETELEEVSQ